MLTVMITPKEHVVLETPARWKLSKVRRRAVRKHQLKLEVHIATMQFPRNLAGTIFAFTI